MKVVTLRKVEENSSQKNTKKVRHFFYFSLRSQRKIKKIKNPKKSKIQKKKKIQHGESALIFVLLCCFCKFIVLQQKNTESSSIQGFKMNIE